MPTGSFGPLPIAAVNGKRWWKRKGGFQRGWLEAGVGNSARAAYTRRMARTQQTFANNKDTSIYVSVEPWPECFELEPGEKLTLLWDAAESGDVAQVDFINDRELAVWPNGQIERMQFLINGEEAEARSWTFKHPKDAATAYRRR